VESSTTTDNQATGGGERGGRDTSRESGKSDDESGSELSEHDDDLKVLKGIKFEVCFKHECKAYPGGD
jgi:hypothetical protein